MLYTIQRLHGQRMAVVLVERGQLRWRVAGPMIAKLQNAFRLPIMLVARDDTAWNNAKAVAEFDTMPCLLELLALSDVDWNEEVFPEPELPL